MLSEKRNQHFRRGSVVSCRANCDGAAPVLGDVNSGAAPRAGWVVADQSAQWLQMGKALVETFPVVRAMVERLDVALQTLQTPPPWSLLGKLALIL